jgi:hypothetical protein
MRVEVANLEEFALELALDAPDVYLGAVRARTRKQEDGETHQHVGFEATAMIKKPDGDYLLEMCLYFGSERIGKHELEDEAAEAEATVQRMCTDLGLTLRPGKWEII